MLEKAAAAANFRLGCCDRAGSFFSGEKAWNNEGVLIHNAIPCKQYYFNPKVRKKLRCLLKRILAAILLAAMLSSVFDYCPYMGWTINHVFVF